MEIDLVYNVDNEDLNDLKKNFENTRIVAT